MPSEAASLLQTAFSAFKAVLAAARFRRFVGKSRLFPFGQKSILLIKNNYLKPFLKARPRGMRTRRDYMPNSALTSAQ
ncbi:hypothetical protein NMA510612_1616 [Neisseria meningitidis]|uniref:Uncharacterized protein n=1 Tax=Neisseria meningitidis TaxID=487 RepID=X5F7C0_NEIME|nr:hypothetical protein NMA510612_1616 [Neisseria meningitidis]